jgi:hypothetical protein
MLLPPRRFATARQIFRRLIFSLIFIDFAIFISPITTFFATLMSSSPRSRHY